ncbi:MAG: sodium:dicarboxylate symporter [candidate division Zixibacteria bacterium SM23_73_2]|nr:MAG: sodium:dicarboxylate symporter [candidate division Zixibacteria bacterium SM23_73_2]
MTKSKSSQIVLIGIFIGILAGGFCGWAFGESMLSVKFLGDIFLNALRMIIVPLIICSMITGVTNLGDIRRLGKTGYKTILYYMATTGISVVIGIILVNLIQPGIIEGAGKGVLPELLKGKEEFSFIDVLMGLIPSNLFKAMTEMQILPLIIFSLLFGGVLTTLGEKAKPVINFFAVSNEAIMKIVHLIIYFAPVGIFGLVAGKLGAVGGGQAFYLELSKLGKYALTVIVGLLIHGIFVLPLLLFVFTKRNPISYLYNMITALTTAFSTASSSATLPVTMECVEKKNLVSQKASSFVLPLGATINMDGTALYEAVAAIFIAQSFGIHLNFSHQVIIFFTATLAAIGAAGIPEAGLVTMVIVLQSVNLPIEGIGLILTIDWFLDRCRTTVNVWGDSVGAAIIAKTKEIEKPTNRI